MRWAALGARPAAAVAQVLDEQPDEDTKEHRGQNQSDGADGNETEERDEDRDEEERDCPSDHDHRAASFVPGTGGNR